MALPGNMDVLILSTVTLLTLAFYMYLIANVVMSRIQYNIRAPKMTGNENFERVLRIQINTSEQLILFIPLLWISGILFNAYFAGLIGILWLISRILYAKDYSNMAEKRLFGFIMGNGCIVLLFLVSIWGILIGFI